MFNFFRPSSVKLQKNIPEISLLDGLVQSWLDAIDSSEKASLIIHQQSMILFLKSMASSSSAVTNCDGLA